jgi:hypothetical protein
MCRSRHSGIEMDKYDIEDLNISKEYMEMEGNSLEGGR